MYRQYSHIVLDCMWERHHQKMAKAQCMDPSRLVSLFPSRSDGTPESESKSFRRLKEQYNSSKSIRHVKGIEFATIYIFIRHFWEQGKYCLNKIHVSITAIDRITLKNLDQP